MIDPNYWYHLSNAYAGDQVVLTKDGYALKMQPLGYHGTNPDQLYRFVPLHEFGEGWYRIYNKEMPTTYSMGCSEDAPIFAKTADHPGQEWHVTLTTEDPQWMGPGWFHFSNQQIGPAKRMDSSKTAPTVGQVGNYPGQYWRLTAMVPVDPLPQPPAKEDQFYKKYASTSQGVSILGTATASDWAVLQSQSVVENMLQSLCNLGYQTKFRGYRTIVVGNNEVLPPTSKAYPYLGNGSDYSWDCIRGGTTDSYAVVTEEMMCRKGVARRAHIQCPGLPDDTTYREFDQIAHEWGHAVDKVLKLNSEAVFAGYDYSEEQFSWAVEKWFKQSFASSPNRSQDREALKIMNLNNQSYATVYDYLASIFDPNKFYYPSPVYHKLFVPG